MPTEQEMRAAIAARDKAYDDRFFYAVVTTGSFLPALVRRAAGATGEPAVFPGHRLRSGCRLPAVQTLPANEHRTGAESARSRRQVH